jgi:hypothetical protein
MNCLVGIGMFQLLFLVGQSGLGIPLGVPPAAEDPTMAAVAPPQCLAYVTWAGTAPPDSKSSNQTEQLLGSRRCRS